MAFPITWKTCHTPELFCSLCFKLVRQQDKTHPQTPANTYESLLIQQTGQLVICFQFFIPSGHVVCPALTYMPLVLFCIVLHCSSSPGGHMVHRAHAHLCQVHSPWIPATSSASFWQLTPPYGTSTSAFLHGVYLDLYKSINTSKTVFNSVIGNTCWTNPCFKPLQVCVSPLWPSVKGDASERAENRWGCHDIWTIATSA